MATDATLLETLAGFADACRSGGVPDEVSASVRRRVLDILGIQLAALDLDTSTAALGFALEQGGAPQAHLVGRSTAIAAPWAAFGNGVLAHSLDYDDTHLPSILHPSASVVPAAVAAAELVQAPGAAAISAIAVGLEVTVRLGMAGYHRPTNNSMFFEHGQHATSICGTVGAAAAAAMVLGADRAALQHAMAVSTSLASGILEANRTGGTVKRLHCGWAAHAGVTAALLAVRGITGPVTALEGRFGFFEAFLHGKFEPEEITETLGRQWTVPGIFFKPYPANHFTHTGIDAARRLRARGVEASSLRRAVLRVATPTVRTIGEPLERKQRPETGYEAQFSGPYTVVAALLGGGGLGLGLEDFTDELARDPYRRALMSRVSVVGDPECDAIYPYQFPAILEVETDGGEHLDARVLSNRGGPDNSLSDEELAAKFRENAARALPEPAIDRLVEAVGGLERLADVTEVLRLTARR